MTTLSTFPAPGSPREKVSEEIRVLLTRRGKTQVDLAAYLGMGQSQLSKRLRGVIPFDVDELAKTAAYFDVSIGALFGEVTVRPGPGGPGAAATSGYRDGVRDLRPVDPEPKVAILDRRGLDAA